MTIEINFSSIELSLPYISNNTSIFSNALSIDQEVGFSNSYLFENLNSFCLPSTIVSYSSLESSEIYSVIPSTLYKDIGIEVFVTALPYLAGDTGIEFVYGYQTDFIGYPRVVNTTQYVDFSAIIYGPAISSYTWSYGDSTFGSGIFTTHRYSSPGYYNVRLDTVDIYGEVRTAIKNNYIYVTEYIIPIGTNLRYKPIIQNNRSHSYRTNYNDNINIKLQMYDTKKQRLSYIRNLETVLYLNFGSYVPYASGTTDKYGSCVFNINTYGLNLNSCLCYAIVNFENTNLLSNVVKLNFFGE